MLSKTTMPPSSRKIAATTISARFWPNAGRSPCPWLIRGRLLVQEAGGLHQLDVPLRFLRHPLGERLAFERGGVERALLDVVLPLGRLLHFLQDADVVRDLVLAHASRHEDAAQHEVTHVEAALLAGRDVGP